MVPDVAPTPCAWLSHTRGWALQTLCCKHCSCKCGSDTGLIWQWQAPRRSATAPSGGVHVPPRHDGRYVRAGAPTTPKLSCGDAGAAGIHTLLAVTPRPGSTEVQQLYGQPWGCSARELWLPCTEGAAPGTPPIIIRVAVAGTYPPW
jgi:hypothetical protein